MKTKIEELRDNAYAALNETNPEKQEDPAVILDGVLERLTEILQEEKDTKTQ